MKYKKILSASFWLIMAIHLLVFIVIGFITQSWRLLFIFFVGVALTLIIAQLIKYIHRRNKEQELKKRIVRLHRYRSQ